LRAVACGWREESITAHAREIAALGRSLHERLLGLSGHFVQLGRTLGQSVTHFNRTIGALESRVLPAARRFEEWQGIPENQHLPALSPLEIQPREPLAAAEIASPLPVTVPGSEDADPSGKARLAAADLRAALREGEPG
jgi:DNA anti-recombination protein RmuC